MSKTKISAESRSFIILFTLAAVGVAIAFYVIQWLNIPTAKYVFKKQKNTLYETSTEKEIGITPPQEKAAEFISVDTTNWKTFSDKSFSFTFKYPPTWKVLAPKLTNGFTLITLDPGAKFDNVKIYISNTGYFAMDGIPYKTDTIAGLPAINIQGMLYGVKSGNTYYTFDEGASVSINSQFQSLVHSVEFSQ